MKKYKLFTCIIFLSSFALLVGACEDFSYPGERPGEYTAQADKQLSVDFAGLDSLRVPAEGVDTVFDVRCNTFWSIKGLVKTVDEQTGEEYELTASWVMAPINVFEGDGRVNVKIGENNTGKPRIADLLFYTSDSNVAQRLPIVQKYNASYVKPIELVFSFTDNSVLGWPSSRSTGEYFYILDGIEYSFLLGECQMSSYLVISVPGSYLGLPAIEDYKLTRIIVHVSSNNKKQRQAMISADPEGTVVVGDTQIWPGEPDIEIVYDLCDTDYNTRYYLYCVSSGLPTAGVTLHYDP